MKAAANILLTCASALLFVHTSATPLPKALDDFDVTKFEGRWYQVAVSVDQFKYQKKPQCAAVNFEIEAVGKDGSKAETPWVRYKAFAQVPEMVGTENGQYVYGNVTQKKVPNTPNHDPAASAGVLNVLFDADSLYPGQQPFSSPEWVSMVEEVDGRYDFAILTNGIKGTNNDWTTVFALSRDRVWAEKYAETLQEYTSDAGFNTSLYMVPNDVGCYFGGPPGVAPEPVQSLDKNKFAGRWYQHRIDKRQYSFQGGVNSKCASNLFTPKTDPVTGNVYIDNVGSAQIGDNVGSDKFKISHSAITPAADGSGVTSVYFPPGDLFPNSPAIKASEWVVDVGGDADGKYEWHIATDGPKYNAMFLNTRETVLKPEILQHFNDYIKSSGYWQDVVEQSQPSNCKYASKAPAQAPAPAPAAPAPPSKTPSPGTLSTSIWVVICLVCLVAGAGITLLGLRSRMSSERSKSYISLADSNA